MPHEMASGAGTGGVGVFDNTRWTLVLALKQEDSALALAALDELCRIYWYPLYVYVRRRGFNLHDAKDMVQGFLACLLRKESLTSACSTKGKFRSFLLTCMNHFLADQHDWQTALKRGGGMVPISIDGNEAEQRYACEPQETQTPVHLFERRWAWTLYHAALARVEKQFAQTGKQDLFAILSQFLADPGSCGSYADAARPLGMSEGAFKKAVQRVREKFRQAFEWEVAQTLASGENIDEEMQYILGLLSA